MGDPQARVPGAGPRPRRRVEPEPHHSKILIVVVTCARYTVDALPSAMDLFMGDGSLKLEVFNSERRRLGSSEVARLRYGDLLYLPHHIETPPHPHTLQSSHPVATYASRRSVSRK